MNRKTVESDALNVEITFSESHRPIFRSRFFNPREDQALDESLASTQDENRLVSHRYTTIGNAGREKPKLTDAYLPSSNGNRFCDHPSKRGR